MDLFKKIIAAMAFFGCSVLKYVSTRNKECNARPAIMNINSSEPLFCPYNVLVIKCSGSCNDINNLSYVFLMLLKT